MVTCLTLALVILVSCDGDTGVPSGPEALSTPPISSGRDGAIQGCEGLEIPKDKDLRAAVDLERRTITFWFLDGSEDAGRTTIEFDEPACRVDPSTHELITTVLDDHLEVIFERRVARCMRRKGLRYVPAPSAGFGPREPLDRALRRMQRARRNAEHRDSLSPRARRRYDLALHGVEDADDESAPPSFGGCYEEADRTTTTSKDVINAEASAPEDVTMSLRNAPERQRPLSSRRFSVPEPGRRAR